MSLYVNVNVIAIDSLYTAYKTFTNRKHLKKGGAKEIKTAKMDENKNKPHRLKVAAVLLCDYEGTAAVFQASNRITSV